MTRPGPKPPTRRTGTREWSEVSLNAMAIESRRVPGRLLPGGCTHGCRYCYARARLLRLRDIEPADWADTTRHHVYEAALWKNWRIGTGVVMCPTAHDITPDTLQPTLNAILRPLEAGRRVLLVTKPHREVMAHALRVLGPYRALVELRYTIGTPDDALRAYWEPGAPSIGERLLALSDAHAAGWATSVSAEPCLSPEHAALLLRLVAPHVTRTVWFGLLNKLGQRVRIETPEDAAQAAAMAQRQGLEQWRTAARELLAEQEHLGRPLLRWKDSLQALLGLRNPEE